MTPKGAIIAVSVMIVGYLIGYTVLSLGGSYTVIEQSLSGRTTWAWAPRAFTDASGHIRLRSALVRFYYPLWRLDNLCWHDDGTGTSGPRHKAIRANEERIGLTD